MAETYKLTPVQIMVLRSLRDGVVERSAKEIAVSARLLPNQVQTALQQLEEKKLVNAWTPITGRTGERLYVLDGESQSILHALENYEGIPQAGTTIPIPSLFSGWFPFTGRATPSGVVEVATDDAAPNVHAGN